jgi:hypothetical protein
MITSTVPQSGQLASDAFDRRSGTSIVTPCTEAVSLPMIGEAASKIPSVEAGDAEKETADAGYAAGWDPPRRFQITPIEPENRKWLFRLVPAEGYKPPSAEAEFAKLISDRMGNFKGADLTNIPHGRELAAEMERCSEDLLSLAKNFCQGGKLETIISNAKWRIVLYDGAAGYIRSRPETVEIVWDAQWQAQKLQFNIDGTSLSSDQEQLIGDVSRAQTVVDVVLSAKAKRHDENALASRKSGYISTLADIARKGLGQSGRVRLATLMLESFKSDFVSREGQSVKNRYVEELLWWSLGIGVPFTIAYGGVRVWHPGGILEHYKSFLMMAAGSCAGTWLSFSIRKVVLGFSDLAMLEDDRLRPPMRLLFVVGLTTVIGVFLALQLIDVQLGPQRLAQRILGSGLAAVFVGLICGISERALASVVSRRTDDVFGRLFSLTSGRADVPTSGSSGSRGIGDNSQGAAGKDAKPKEGTG